jgi:hypothetical protein
MLRRWLPGARQPAVKRGLRSVVVVLVGQEPKIGEADIETVRLTSAQREGIGMSEVDHGLRHSFITDPYGARHYEKLGRFIFQYAQAEAQFHLAFRYYSEMPIAVARRRFKPGVRIDYVIEETKKLIRQKELADDFECITEQFKDIKCVRNQIVHRGWSVLADEFVVTNIVTAPDVNHPEKLTVKFPEMDDMIEDLILISLCLRYRHIAPEIYKDMPQPRINISWRYKPSGKGKTRKPHG